MEGRLRGSSLCTEVWGPRVEAQRMRFQNQRSLVPNSGKLSMTPAFIVLGHAQGRGLLFVSYGASWHLDLRTMYSVLWQFSPSDQNLECLLTSVFGSSLSSVFQSLNFYAISRILNIATGCLKLKGCVLGDALNLPWPQELSLQYSYLGGLYGFTDLSFVFGDLYILVVFWHSLVIFLFQQLSSHCLGYMLYVVCFHNSLY